MNRFIFISSVAVHGPTPLLPLGPDSPIHPTTPYGKSKADGEAAVRRALSDSATRWAILRPVLVYGPGNPGNLARLAGIVRRGIPIPVSRCPNQRSFLFVDNLVDLIKTFLSAVAPPSGRTWPVADRERLSTEHLVRVLAASHGRRGRTLHLPWTLLHATARLGDFFNHLGLSVPWSSEVLSKISGDFFVDVDSLNEGLGWEPPFTLEEGMRRTFPPTVGRQTTPEIPPHEGMNRLK
ncbi:MAG: NAD-dependent epimerase/dehydratase family protein [Holophaga sp.]|nr:NAD-dependent epimerase/dehydratase family protein [Holophaga sp.]